VDRFGQTDDVQIWLSVQQTGDAFAKEGVVVNNKYTHE